METITIPYEDYKSLVDKASMYLDITREIRYILRDKTEWNKWSKCLNYQEDIENFIKKYFPNDYEERFNELKELNKEREENEDE